MKRTVTSRRVGSVARWALSLGLAAGTANMAGCGQMGRMGSEDMGGPVPVAMADGGAVDTDGAMSMGDSGMGGMCAAPTSKRVYSLIITESGKDVYHRVSHGDTVNADGKSWTVDDTNGRLALWRIEGDTVIRVSFDQNGRASEVTDCIGSVQSCAGFDAHTIGNIETEANVPSSAGVKVTGADGRSTTDILDSGKPSIASPDGTVRATLVTGNNSQALVSVETRGGGDVFDKDFVLTENRPEPLGGGRNAVLLNADQTARPGCEVVKVILRFNGAQIVEAGSGKTIRIGQSDTSVVVGRMVYEPNASNAPEKQIVEVTVRTGNTSTLHVLSAAAGDNTLTINTNLGAVTLVMSGMKLELVGSAAADGGADM